jgi:hypothetical protein
MTTRAIRRLCLLLCGAALVAFPPAASAQATYLQLGVTNTSNSPTSLKGTTGAPELYVMNANGNYAGIKAESSGGLAAAVFGLHSSAAGAGAGVQGISASTAANAFGVFGQLMSSAPGADSAAVRGENRGTNTSGYGVWGSHAGSGPGVFGTSISGRGVFGFSTNGVGLYGVTGATNGTAIHGVANSGPYASGVSGESSTGAGVYGFNSGGTGQGVAGVSTKAAGTGVVGEANNGTLAYGVYGKSASGRGVDGSSPNGYGGYFGGATGVKGISSATNGTGVIGEADNGSGASGVIGSSTATDGTGVRGEAPNGGYASGVYGESGNGYGVFGKATLGSGNGVYGLNTAYNGKGIVAEATGGGDKAYAVLATAAPPGFAGYFKGDISVNDWAYIHNLSVSYCTGCLGPSALKVDDPLDPAHKYLQHAGVASAEQLDLYSGNAITDARGFATVTLPRWFQALNRDFRYQLTVVGKQHWDAKAAVWEEIEHDRFVIRTDQPRVTVSWEVTAVRHDAYANAHQTPVELPKAQADQGKYLNPDVYGKPQREKILTPRVSP